MDLEKNDGIAVAIFTKDVLEIVYNKLKNIVDSKESVNLLNNLLKGLFPDIKNKINKENGIAFVYSKYALYVTHINKNFNYQKFSQDNRLRTLEDDYTDLRLICKENKKYYNMDFRPVTKYRLTSTKWNNNKEPEFIYNTVKRIADFHSKRLAIYGKGKILEIIILIKEDEKVYKKMAETFFGNIEGISIRYLVAKI